MIIVKLMGGLGNQMFQYAFGRALGIHLKQEIFYDKSWFYQDFVGTTPRELKLEAFNISLPYTKLESPFFKTKIGKHIKSVLQKTGLQPKYIKVNEETFALNQINGHNNYYFESYWQNPEYFEDVRDIILAEFNFQEFSNPEDANLQRMICDCESIAIHIRRGDYVNSPKTNQFHGTCSIGYYKEAANRVLSKIPNAKFFLFTDDPDYVKSNLGFLCDCMLVSNNRRSEVDELNLMHSCKHFIIANSSFSWWGAWLSQNSDKIVISPKQWFKNEEANEKCKIVPKDWIRI